STTRGGLSHITVEATNELQALPYRSREPSARTVLEMLLYAGRARPVSDVRQEVRPARHCRFLRAPASAVGADFGITGHAGKSRCADGARGTTPIALASGRRHVGFAKDSPYRMAGARCD